VISCLRLIAQTVIHGLSLRRVSIGNTPGRRACASGRNGWRDCQCKWRTAIRWTIAFSDVRFSHWSGDPERCNCGSGLGWRQAQLIFSGRRAKPVKTEWIFNADLNSHRVGQRAIQTSYSVTPAKQLAMTGAAAPPGGVAARPASAGKPAAEEVERGRTCRAEFSLASATAGSGR
jgi:hypothetical protein